MTTVKLSDIVMFSLHWRHKLATRILQIDRAVIVSIYTDRCDSPTQMLFFSTGAAESVLLPGLLART